MVPLFVLRNAGARPQRRGAQQWLTNGEEHWPRLTHLSRNRGPVQGASRRQFVRVTCSSGRYVRPERLTYFLFRFLAARSYRLCPGLWNDRGERERTRERFSFEFSGESLLDLDANCDSWPPEDEQHLAAACLRFTIRDGVGPCGPTHCCSFGQCRTQFRRIKFDKYTRFLLIFISARDETTTFIET